MGLLDQFVDDSLLQAVEDRFRGALLSVLYDPQVRRSFVSEVSARGNVKREPLPFYNNDVDDAAWTRLFGAEMPDRRGFVFRNVGGENIYVTVGDDNAPADVTRYDILVPGAVEDYPWDDKVKVWVLAVAAGVQAACGYEYK